MIEEQFRPSLFVHKLFYSQFQDLCCLFKFSAIWKWAVWMLLEGSQWKGEVPTHPKNTKETEKLSCTVPEHTVVWRHITPYPLIKPESVMVATIMTILIMQE